MDDEDQLEVNEEKEVKSENESQEDHKFDILSQKCFKIVQNCILNVTKDSKNVSRDVKRNCKILKFSSDYEYDEVIKFLSDLKCQEFPNLFIIVVDCKNINFKKSKKSTKVERIKRSLIKLSENRPMILQIKSEQQNVTKFYYKEQDSLSFNGIDKSAVNFEKNLNFPTFLCSVLDGQFEASKETVIDQLKELKNCSLILKFLRIFELSEDFIEDLVLECAESGTKNEFLAALDVSIENNRQMLNTETQNLLYTRFIYGKDSNNQEVDEPINQMDGDSPNASSSVTSDHENQMNQADPKEQPENNIGHVSVLSKAVEYSNKDVVDYLITYCSHLIQLLPFDHQVQISLKAFNTNQFDVLCDLIQISDFPFPENFKLDGIENERLNEIVAERTKLYESIDDEDLKEITKFINKNINLRIAYNTENKSAMQQSVDEKSYKSFYFLKSQGFYATEFVDLEDVLSKEELKEAIKVKIKQRQKNAKEGLNTEPKSVNLLCNRSFIHNRKTVKDKEAEYRKVIRKWFEDINKIKYGKEFLNVAASCKGLKIIFDFESETDENVSLGRAGSLGVLCPNEKWIFIGAKLDDDGTEGKRFQKVKGVLAHELCHYVMKLIYENAEHPYYKYCKDTIEKFEAVVAAINKWVPSGINDPDDECDGIISSVFRHYAEQDFHPELIVRVMQILVQYDNDKEKSEQLEDKYKVLFNYWEEQVWPEIKKFDLKKREKVRKINRIFQLINIIEDYELELIETKIDINALLDNKFVIIKTNVPKLLLIDIYDNLYDKFDVLIDTKNIFVDPKVLKNSENCQDFKNLLKENPKLNLIVDCTARVCDELKTITFSSESRLFFVVRNENQAEEVNQILTNQCSKDISVEYNWNDLSEKSQNQLLQSKINFQNNSKVSLLKLFETKKEPQGSKEGSSKSSSQSADLPSLSPAIDPFSDRSGINFSEIVDDELLNLILSKQPIHVNNGFKEPEHFCFLSKRREFVELNRRFFSEDVLLYKVQNDKFVLISDIAGNGKSWAMIQISKTLMEKYPTCWVTYVDLKQFIKEFKAQQNEILEFSKFLTEKILKLDKNNFEAKIFQKMYEIGKVFIIFDGFDEIAPDCAEFVCKLAKSFEQNGGNQLWIATRDYFKVNLQKELQIEEAWKLDNFTEYVGARIITNSWMLNEPEAKEIKTEEEFVELINKSLKFKNFLEMAKKIAEKVSVSKSYGSIGMPQIYKIVAEVSKNNKEATIGYTQTNLYKSLFQELYWRWATQKGDIRIQANKNSLEFDLKFKEIHQYLAILTLFPEIAEVLFKDYDKNEWTDEEVVAGGIVRIEDGKYFFNHETLREYFVADFIAKELKKVSPQQEVVDMIAKVLTVKKFGVIRMFLNEMLNSEDLNKIVPKMQTDENIKMFRYMDSFGDICSNGQDKFIDFVLQILNSKNYFNDKHLKILITEDKVFLDMIESGLEIEYFEEFVTKMEIKFGKEIINKEMKVKTWRKENIFSMLSKSKNFNVSKLKKFLEILQKYLNLGEIFKLLYNCDEDEETFLQSILEIEGYRSYLKKIKEPLKCWKEIEEMIGVEIFKKLVSKEDSKGSNILFYLEKLNVDEFKDFFDKMFELFDLKTLEEMIMKINNKGECFMNELNFKRVGDVLVEIIAEKFGKIKFGEILKLKLQKKDGRKWEIEYKIKDLGWKNLEIFKTVWDSLKQVCDTDQEFLQIINKSGLIERTRYKFDDDDGEKIKFIIDELEKLKSSNELKKLLNNSEFILIAPVLINEKYFDVYKKLCKIYSENFNFYEIIKIVEIFFVKLIQEGNLKQIEFTWNEPQSFENANNSVLIHMLRRLNWKHNLLALASENCPEVFDWTKKLFDEFGINFEIKIFGEFDKEFEKCLKSENHEKVEELLTKYEKIFKNQNLTENFKYFLLTQNSEKTNFLRRAVFTKNIEIVKVLWSKISKIPNNSGIISEIFKEIDHKHQTILHTAVDQSSCDIFEFLFNQLESIESIDEIKEVLSYYSRYTPSLFHLAAENVKLINFHEELWKIYKKYLRPEEIVELITEEDHYDLLQIAAKYNTIEIIELTWNNYKSLISKNEQIQYLREKLPEIFNKLQKNETNKVKIEEWIKNIFVQYPLILLELRSMDKEKLSDRELFLFVENLKFDENSIKKNLLSMNENENLFQYLTDSGYDYLGKINAEEYLKNLRKYLTVEEILKLMKNCNEKGENIFHLLVKTKNCKILIEWLKAVKSLLSPEEQENSFFDLLVQTNSDGHNFLHLSAFNNSFYFHERIWNHLKDSLTNDQIFQICFQKNDKNDKNFVEFLVENSKNLEVVVYIYKILKSRLEQEYEEEVQKFRTIIEQNENFTWCLNFDEFLVENNKNLEVVVHIYEVLKERLSLEYQEEVQKFRALIEKSQI